MNRVIIAACGLCASSLAMGSVTIDFELDGMLNPLSAGVGFASDTYNTSFFLFTTITAMPNTVRLNLFDSTRPPSPTGVDPDLETGGAFPSPPQNLVLIGQDDGVPLSNPDDNEDGVGFVFSFGVTDGVFIKKVALIDLEENGVPNFSAVETDGDVLASVAPSNVTLLSPGFTGNNSLREYEFDLAEGVSQFTVAIPDASGALAYIEYEEVPAPGAIALAGAAGLVLTRRRR